MNPDDVQALRDEEPGLAIQWYTEHAHALAPTDVATLRWIATRLRPALPVEFRAVTEAAVEAAEPCDGAYLLQRLGSTAWYEGRVAEAEGFWRRSLQLCREDGRSEVVAGTVTNNLALALEHRGSFFEALVLYRSVLATRAGREHEDQSVFAYGRLASCLAQLGEGALALEALAQARSGLEGWEGDGRRDLHVTCLGVEAKVHARLGDHAAAVRAYDEALRCTCSDTHLAVRDALEVQRIRARFEVEPRGARELLEELEGLEDRSGPGADWAASRRRQALLLRWRVAVDEDDVRAAQDAALGFLDELESEFFFDTLEQAVDLLMALPIDPEVHERLLDAATECALRRAFAARKEASRIPELVDVSAEDREILRRHRARLAEERSPLLLRLAERLRPGEPAYDRFVQDGLFCICAWCLRVRDENGVWGTSVELTLVEPEGEVTHGICEPCLRELRPTTSDLPVGNPTVSTS